MPVPLESVPRSCRRRADRVVVVVKTEVTWLDERGFDVEGVRLVKHALDEAFYGGFGGAVRCETRDAEGAGGGGEDEVAARDGVSAEVGQGELYNVQGAQEVGFELIKEVVLGLVFRCGHDAYIYISVYIEACKVDDVKTAACIP